MIDWKKVWDTLEEWIVADTCEGIASDVNRHRHYVQLIVEKQLRKGKQNEF